MSEASTHRDAGDPGSPDVRLRPAAPARSTGIGDLQAGDPVQIDDYRLIGQLGVGGMGTVYLGQAATGERVAIKLVHGHLARDPRFRVRFAGEVRAAQRVPGFCTARVLDSGVYDDRPYLVTEYLDGIPLSRLVTDDGPLDPASLHGVALGVAAALAAIHSVGLVHRDLKPSNLMVTLGGVRIIDFGIARAMDVASDVTGTGNIVGSLGWASPEQLRAEEPRPAMDIFGWGCLVAFAATGRHPFGGEEAAARAWKILEGEPELAGIPDPLRELVGSALQRDPEERPDARQLLLMLAVGEADSPSPPARRWLRGGINPRRRVTSMAIALPMALALVFTAAEATSELMGGDSGAVSSLGTGPGSGEQVLGTVSPQPNPGGSGVRDVPVLRSGVPINNNPTNGPLPGPTVAGAGGVSERPLESARPSTPPQSPSSSPSTTTSPSEPAPSASQSTDPGGG